MSPRKCHLILASFRVWQYLFFDLLVVSSIVFIVVPSTSNVSSKLFSSSHRPLIKRVTTQLTKHFPTQHRIDTLSSNQAQRWFTLLQLRLPKTSRGGRPWFTGAARTCRSPSLFPASKLPPQPAARATPWRNVILRQQFQAHRTTNGFRPVHPSVAIKPKYQAVGEEGVNRNEPVRPNFSFHLSALNSIAFESHSVLIPST